MPDPQGYICVRLSYRVSSIKEMQTERPRNGGAAVSIDRLVKALTLIVLQILSSRSLASRYAANFQSSGRGEVLSGLSDLSDP